MLQVLVGYTLDANIDIRWLVMSADPEFFSITKRIHNRLHGTAGDAGELGPSETAHYARDHGCELRRRDQPSPAGRRGSPPRPANSRHGSGTCRSRSPGGLAMPHRTGRRATSGPKRPGQFLRPHLAHCEAYIFSLPEYVPSWIEESKVRVIPPSIDPFSPKNQDMSPSNVILTLGRIGLLLKGCPRTLPERSPAATVAPGHVERQAAIVSAERCSLAI